MKLYNAIVREHGIVPDCSYCAAMRWSVISSLVTAFVLGIAVKSILACLIGGAICGATFVAFLYGVYKIEEKEGEEEEPEEPEEKGWGSEVSGLPYDLYKMIVHKGWKNLTVALSSYAELERAYTKKCMELKEKE